jgi:alkanesulfonate monooxygenase SsuD/methylene tetrahydromethanopterin reductase-like flavin-dependent oxidoreductase (luciferase family)
LLVFGDIAALNHPVRTAEELVTLDALSDGNAAVLSVVGYRDEEFDAFGIAMSERGRRAVESYEIVARLCSGETVDYAGEFYTLRGVQLGALRPVAVPRPPVWVTGLHDRSLRRVAEFGDIWFPSHQPTLSELRDQVERLAAYRTTRPAAPHHAHDDHGISLPLLRETFVAPTSEAALRTAEGPMGDSVRSYIESGQLESLNDPRSYSSPFEKWVTDRAIVGDPEVAVREITRYRDELGVDCLIMKITRKGIPFDEILDCIRLIGHEVIPYFRTT